MLIAALASYRCQVGFTQPRCRLGQRIKHRLQVERRATDHLQHIGGGGLLLERFAQLAEQAGVLDRNYGLRSEVLDQLDLLVSEETNFLSLNGYNSH
jgi:hypothetical protein